MRIFLAAALSAILAGPAYAQGEAPIPRYGETDKDKTRQQIQSEKAAQQAYQRSLGNIPDKGPSDPWGNVRSESAPKAAAKPVPAKPTKTRSTAN
ncbi:MAG TPA: hypothetical protein VG271_02415 [Beijerinckiaceae bacterium]|jgi:hypothetical protein|nr:hypothetical protein [Beijerinckiaceae bacterium]